MHLKSRRNFFISIRTTPRSSLNDQSKSNFLRFFQFFKSAETQCSRQVAAALKIRSMLRTKSSTCCGEKVFAFAGL